MLDVSLEGPFKMKAETKLSLTPSKCDDIEFFGEKMHVCAVETITKVRFLQSRLNRPFKFGPVLTIFFQNMQVKVTPLRKVFKLMLAKWRSTLTEPSFGSCDSSILERDIDLEPSDSENIEMKILFTKFDSSLRAELESSAVNYVMTFKFDKK